ncbi:hypothetical protein NE237_003952 [Protea cynaroides]|uniref:Uncharacterized protein n=1 Tax=Protea cynaroides TaxID=273540 RepID=A0A9Q0KHS0_9MAGN|nr:hypothetical protein NE237_003952 [Protea cynaroides]
MELIPRSDVLAIPSSVDSRALVRLMPRILLQESSSHVSIAASSLGLPPAVPAISVRPIEPVARAMDLGRFLGLPDEDSNNVERFADAAGDTRIEDYRATSTAGHLNQYNSAGDNVTQGPVDATNIEGGAGINVQQKGGRSFAMVAAGLTDLSGLSEPVFE